MQRRDRFRRNAIRVTMLTLMFLPILMGGNSDCDSSSSDTYEIVSLIFDVVLAIIYAFA